MLNSNRTADPFETWHKNRSSLTVVLFVIKIFKMATNIKKLKIVKNSKMNRFQWKWIFTENKTCCTIWWPFWFAMVAIFNQKWPSKYKNSTIWAKFVFQVDYDVANWYPSLGSHIISYLAFALYLIKSPNEVWRLIFFATFLIIIKSPNEAWPHLYRKLQKGFPQDLAYILNRVGRIFWPKKIAGEWPPFSNWPPTKLAKFQCSLISMKIDIHFLL
jgi:hypothetical protein